MSHSTPVAWGAQNSANVWPCACRKRRLIMGYKLSAPVAWGVRIQPTSALKRVVSGDYLRNMRYTLPPAHCMQGLLA